MKRDRKLYFDPDEPLKDRNWTKEERSYAQEQRLKKKYGKRRKYKLVWDVEEAWTWWEWYEDFDWLFELLQSLIVSKAKSAANKWSGLRIPVNEFESYFWMVALKAAIKHNPDGDFLLYETIERNIKSRTLDITRHYGFNNQQGFELNAVSLDSLQRELPDWKVDVGESVTDKLFLQQLLTDPSILNREERELLQIRIDHPEATLRELAAKAGYSKDKVSRVIVRCDKKVRQECPDLFHRISFYSTGRKNRATMFSDSKSINDPGASTKETKETESQPSESETVETTISEEVPTDIS